MNRIAPRIASDGRWASALLVVGYFALLFSFQRSAGNDEAWGRLGVSHMEPIFADLCVITSGVDCAEAGHDPLVSNPCDPWQRRMNYPRIWLTIGSILHLHYQHSTALGVGLAGLFFTTCFFLVGRLSLTEGTIFGLMLVSPPVMFAVERGNNDLVVFILLGLALVGLGRDQFSRRWWSYGLVFLAALLKLYPICALVLCWREKPRLLWAMTAVLFASFALYLIFIYRDLVLIGAGTPRSSFASYGSRALFDRLRFHHLPSNLEYLPWVGVGLVTLCALFATRRFPKMQIPAKARDSLRLGAALYVATFVLGNNWNYRLVLLLLAMPGIFALIRDNRSALTGGFLLLITSLMFLSTAQDGGRVLFCLKEMIAWTTFFVLMVILIQLRPPHFLPGLAGIAADKGDDSPRTV